MNISEIVSLFGGQSALSRLLGIKQNTISYWISRDSIPTKWQSALLQKAKEMGIALYANDLLPTHITSIKIKDLPTTITSKIDSTNGYLLVEKSANIDGIEMGVLSNGDAYLSEYGLAAMCGVARQTLREISDEFNNNKKSQRLDIIRKHLDKQYDSLFVSAKFNDVIVNAYKEDACMSILEYYAMYDHRPEAIKSYTTLARAKFREFIYEAVGYNPEQIKMASWKHYHDRTDLTKMKMPMGYFAVFHEIGFMIVPMISSGIIINDKMLPDISVGRYWSEHWNENELFRKYGDRVKYDHEYPPYYPQSKSNPQAAYAYPNGALGEFRDWFHANYLVHLYPRYLSNQCSRGMITHNNAVAAVKAITDCENGRPKLIAG